MNSEFGWSIAIIFFSLLILGISIGLYLYWKNKSDYKSEIQHIVWSISIAGLALLLVGIGMMVWSISKCIDTKKSINSKNLLVPVNSGTGDEYIPLPCFAVPPWMRQEL